MPPRLDTVACYTSRASTFDHATESNTQREAGKPDSSTFIYVLAMLHHIGGSTFSLLESYF